MSDILEDLDNKSLREKWLAYGLPNIPITTTSRALVIKKLRKAIENGIKPTENATVNQKTRRETVHVIKIQTEEPEKDDAEKSKPRNRKTMGGATPRVMLERMNYEHQEKKDVPEKKSTKTTKVKNADTPAKIIQAEEPNTPQRRRSTRASSTPQPKSVVDAEHNKKNYNELLEEDEEDFAQIAPTLERSSSRTSHSSSLSTSPLVTTSFRNKDANINDWVDEDDDDDDSEPDVVHVGIPPRPQHMEQAPSYNPFKSYETVKPSTSTYTMRYSTGGVQQSPMRSSALERTTTSKYSYEPGVTRRQTTVTGSRPAPVSEYIKSLTQSSEDKENSDELDMEERSPYLSRFAQRISRLQAEPLRSSIGSPLRSSASNLDNVRFRSPPITSRRRISEQESIRESFYKFVIAMDNKYNLKGVGLLAAVLFIILIMFFVFF